MPRPHRVCCLIGILSLLAQPAWAQIAVPDVSSGAQSSVPNLTKTPFVSAPANIVKTPFINGISPTTPDPRCRQLTPEQRQVTPGCQ